MVNPIPSRDDYYFDGTCFRIKSKIAERIKWFIIAVFFFGGVMTSSATVFSPDRVISIKKEFPTEIAGIHKYISSKLSDKKEINEITESIMQWSERFSIDPLFITSVMQIESQFDKHAISPVGAFGLMQVLPRWHNDKIIKARKELDNPEVFNIDTNIYLGSWILSDCLKQFKTEDKALRCYNGSIGMATDYDKKVLAVYQQLKNFIKKGA